MESAKARPGAHCGSDHELLIAKFRLNLNKAGKTTRPSRYNLNPFWIYIGGDEYIQEIKPRKQWAEVCNIVLKAATKTIPKKKKSKKAQWLSEEALQIAEERRETNSWRKKRNKKQGRKGKVHPTKCRVPKNKETQERLFQWTMLKNRGKQQKGKH